MRYRRLGDCGLLVSVVALGTATYGGPVSAPTAVQIIRRAHDGGVNLFDTADEYQEGRAELALGQALTGIPRDSVVLATKVFFPVGDGANQRGLSRKHIMESIDASLRRLAMDYVDLYQCHRYDENTPLHETCRTMNDLVRSGKVLYWGVSEWTPTQIEQAALLCRGNGWVGPISNQAQYSALWRAIEPHVMTACQEFGLGVLAWSPLAFGVLTGRYGSDREVAPTSRVGQELDSGQGATLSPRYWTRFNI